MASGGGGAIGRAIGILNAIGKLALGVGVLGVASTAAMYNVDGGERALIFDRFQGGITNQVRIYCSRLHVPCHNFS
jgi:hypothetical protein